MEAWMFIIIMFLALILFLLLFIYEDQIQFQWAIGLIIFDIALWWALASGQFEIETPYTLFNASSGNIETGYHIFSSKTSPALTYIFSAPAVFMFMYMNVRIFQIIRTWWKKTYG